MKSVKKSISVLTALCILCALFTFGGNAKSAGKNALPLSAGMEALRSQFESGVGDECNGYAMDYCYYSPVGENDKEKYPVVIFLHGIGHGSYEGSQLSDSHMAIWASKEMQSKWHDTKGAYILLPRCPEDELQYWSKTFIDPLRVMIDCFIEEHSDNVDTRRIFIGGSSAGGEMAWDMAIEYPEYFAGIYPLAATGTRSDADIKKAKDVSVWVFSSKLDPIVNYYTETVPQWNKICEYNSNPGNCRLSSFGMVLNPDGTKADSNHRLYTTISYDLFMTDGSVYPNVTTENGNGERVLIENGQGIISWMSNTYSDFDGNASEKEADVSFIASLFIPLRNIILKIANIFQRLLGFV